MPSKSHNNMGEAPVFIYLPCIRESMHIFEMAIYLNQGEQD